MAMFVHLGRTLSLLRELRGKSQARVAREAGIGKSQLSKYENGKELPKLDSLEKVLIALEVGYFEFFYTLHLVDRRAADLERWRRRAPLRAPPEHPGEGQNGNILRGRHHRPGLQPGVHRPPDPLPADLRAADPPARRRRKRSPDRRDPHASSPPSARRRARRRGRRRRGSPGAGMRRQATRKVVAPASGKGSRRSSAVIQGRRHDPHPVPLGRRRSGGRRRRARSGPRGRSSG